MTKLADKTKDYMKSIIKSIALSLMLVACGGIISCEDDSSSKSSDNEPYLLTEKVTITYKDYIMYEEGDFPINFHTESKEYLIIPTTSTRIMLQRPSCSGFSESDANSIKGNCVIKYYTDQIDYGEGKPYPIRPQEIWIIDPACEPTDNDDCCEPCN